MTLEGLVSDIASEGAQKNHAAANRMYEALIYIANVGSGEAKQEALCALRFRNGQPTSLRGNKMTRNPDFEKAAQFLWGLLDDIDTASDRAKADDKTYRAIVERIHRRRFEIGSTDGYIVTFDAQPASVRGDE